MARLNWATVALLVASQMSGPSRAQELPSQVEEIRIVRSVRLSRNPATGYCNAERTGFEGAQSEDQYDFRVVITGASDGIVVNATSVPIGKLHACFGPSSDPEVTNFFGQGTLAGVTFAGRGDCRLTKRHFPEQGMMTYRCFLDLRGLPEGYIGGMLTTNTVTSRQTIGEVSDPPGYVQPSIATVRLWKSKAN